MPSPLRSVAPDVDLPPLLEELTLPQLQVAEALAALGPSVSLARLTRVLTGSDTDPAVAPCVEQLCAAGLARRDGAALVPAPGLREAFGRPLGLGPTLADAIAALYADDIRRIARNLGLPALGRKETTLGPVVARLGEPGVIAAILAEAPDGVLDELLTMAGCDDASDPDDHDDGYGWNADQQWYADYRDEAPARDRWRSHDDHSWARDRGLVVPRHHDGRTDLPAEVALVLRGPDYRAPWTPERPVAATQPAGVRADQAVDLTGHVACQTWLRLTRLCGALLEEAARKPLPRRRSGELTAPGLKRLASSLKATTEELHVVLALAKAAGLIVTGESAVDPGKIDEWLEAEIPQRAAILARQLCVLTRPLGGGPAPRTYSWSPPKPPTDVSSLRRKLLVALGELPVGECTRLETIEPLVRWDAPRAAGADTEALSALWREAESVALIVNGSVSPVGRALVEADQERLTTVFSALLPASVDEAVIDADLVATVTGLPTRRVSRVLDSLAVREKDDTATTWQFTPTSVRRAFDEGGTLDSVTAGLTSISPTSLPHTLIRLIADIARRHGHLAVSLTGTVITSDDPVLLSGLRHSPALRHLALRPLAPGMLFAESPHDRTLELLRGGGYLPVTMVRDAAAESSHG